VGQRFSRNSPQAGKSPSQANAFSNEDVFYQVTRVEDSPRQHQPEKRRHSSNISREELAAQSHKDGRNHRNLHQQAQNDF
jgi:hypothetical protein